MKKKTGNTETHLKRATSSFLENTLPIFLPVRNIHRTKAHALFKKNNGLLRIETSFGAIEVRGRILGQFHKDIIEMLLCQKKILINQDNSIAVNFGRYAFLKDIGKNPHNYIWLEDKIKEIKDFNFGVNYYTRNGGKIEIGGFGIIDKYKFEDNRTMSVKFTEEFTNFYRDENLLDYRNYVPKIAKMNDPFLKAVVREMVKSKKWNIRFKTLINNYGFKALLGSTEIKKFKKLLRNEENLKYLKENFNIEIEPKGTDLLIKIDRDQDKEQVKVAILINDEDRFITKQDEVVLVNYTH